MGSKLTRPSTSSTETTKSKWKKEQRKGVEKAKPSIEGDQFLIQNEHERKTSNDNLNNVHQQWDSRNDQQELTNFNVDPPGAPSTYSMNYSMGQHDPKERPWSSPQLVNNQFYPGNSLPVTTTSGVAYDINQFVHTQSPQTFNNLSQHIVLDERPSKKVQFARPLQHQGTTTTKNSLTNTQSWHEPSNPINDIVVTTGRQELVPNRQSIHRSVASTTNNTAPSSSSSAQASGQKPIYVGIDHKATLAERGQSATTTVATAQKRHHKTSDRNNSDGSVSMKNTTRARPHTHHQHKHQEEIDLSSSKTHAQSHKPLEPFQGKLSGTQRPLTIAATSTVIANRQVQHPDQSLFNDIEMRVPKTRGNRQAHSQQIDLQTIPDNKTRPLRNKENHIQPRQQPRIIATRHHSPQRNEAARRLDNKQQDTPIMRIPISQQQQQPQRHKQSTLSPKITRTPPLSRSRV